MKIAFAPMEGLTGALYRQAHCRWFGGVDHFILHHPTQDHRFTKREGGDSARAQWGLTAVPQLLVRRAEDFLWAAGSWRPRLPGDQPESGLPLRHGGGQGQGSGFQLPENWAVPGHGL